MTDRDEGRTEVRDHLLTEHKEGGKQWSTCERCGGTFPPAFLCEAAPEEVDPCRGEPTGTAFGVEIERLAREVERADPSGDVGEEEGDIVEEIALLMWDTAFPNRREVWPNVRDHWRKCAQAVIRRLRAEPSGDVGEELQMAERLRSALAVGLDDGLTAGAVGYAVAGMDMLLARLRRTPEDRAAEARRLLIEEAEARSPDDPDRAYDILVNEEIMRARCSRTPETVEQERTVEHGEDDIVERLLSAVSVIESTISGAPIPIGSKDLQDAVDEIRRLTKDLEMYRWLHEQQSLRMKALHDYIQHECGDEPEWVPGGYWLDTALALLKRLRSQEPVGYVVMRRRHDGQGSAAINGYFDQLEDAELWVRKHIDEYGDTFSFRIHPVAPPIGDES